MAASFTPPRARASRPSPRRQFQKTSTPVGLVKASHWYRRMFRSASSIAGQGAMGSVAMQGSSHTPAPRSRSRSDKVPARPLGRVTSTRFPWRGRRANQHSSGPRAHTPPTISSAGLWMPISAIFRGRVSSVASQRRWLGRVPFSTMAAGVSGAMPAPSSPSAIFGAADTLIRNTSVPPPCTRAL